MSDTPETNVLHDKIAQSSYSMDEWAIEGYDSMFAHARKLERERDEARAVCAEILEALMAITVKGYTYDMHLMAHAAIAKAKGLS